MSEASPHGAMLVLARHGESASNKANCFTGLLDPPLTPLGEQQTLAVGAYLAHLPSLPSEGFDIAYTSLLVRAQRSLELIQSVLGPERGGKQVVRVAVLNERDYGELNGKSKAETAKAYGTEQTNLWRRSYSAVPPGGESLEMVVKKVWAWYELEVKPRLARGEKVLIVSHGNTLRGLVMKLEGMSAHEVLKLQLGPAATRIYSCTPEGDVTDCIEFP